MKISVIIPAYNAERFLGEAIASVIAQTHPADEIIVVDDGSTDRTAQVATQFERVRVHSIANGGAGAARNVGIQISRGDHLAFLDADDLWEPEKLALQTQAFARDESLEAAFGHAIEFSDDQISQPLPAPVPGTMLIKRAAFERIGWFDGSRSAREGADWYLRALEKSLRTRMLDEVVYRRRLHDRNRSIVERDYGAYLRAIKTSLDRRRAHAQRERT